MSHGRPTTRSPYTWATALTPLVLVIGVWLVAVIDWWTIPTTVALLWALIVLSTRREEIRHDQLIRSVGYLGCGCNASYVAHQKRHHLDCITLKED